MGRGWDKPDGKDTKTVGAKSKGKAKATGDQATLPITPESSETKPKTKKPRTSTATSLAESPNGADSKVSKPKTKKEPKPVPNGKVSTSSDSLSPPPAVSSGPKPHDPTKKQRPSHVFSFSDSSLTDEEDGDQSTKAGEPSKAKPKTSTKKDKNTTKKDKITNKKETKSETKAEDKKSTKKGEGKAKSTKAANGKEKQGKVEKGKGKAKEAKDGEKKVRAKPVKKVEVPVDPPVFEKVDTRLGRVEAEHRIMVSPSLRT